MTARGCSALDSARLGKYDLLLVYRVDRLSRSVRGLAQIIEELDTVGVAFRSATEPFDTANAAGRMMVQMLGVFAEFERASIVERTVAGLAKKASKGEWTGGTAPYGYEYDKDNGVLVQVPNEVEVVQEIFHRYAIRLHGSATISGWLNDEDVPTRRGGRWTPQRVIDVLRNSTHLGELPFKGESYASAHEANIERHLFDRAQTILVERGENYPLRNGNASDYLLSSLMRCTRCNHGFVGTDSHGTGGKYRYYTCYVRHRQGTARCDQDRIPAPPTEQGVIASVVQVLRDSRLLKEASAQAVAKWQEQHPGLEKDLGHLEKKRRKAEMARDRYVKAFEGGRLSDLTFAQRVSELEDEIATLRTETDLVQDRIGSRPEVAAESLARAAAERLEETLTNGEPQTVRGLLRALVDRIEVDGREHIQPFIRVDAATVLTVAEGRPRR